MNKKELKGEVPVIAWYVQIWLEALRLRKEHFGVHKIHEKEQFSTVLALTEDGKYNLLNRKKDPSRIEILEFVNSLRN